MKIFLQIIFGISLLLNIQLSFAQSFTGATKVTSAVPFLTISPDAKAGAMGESGAATQPDVFSQFWNPAKYPFIENSIGISYSFSPWLRALVQDINLTYIVGYFKLGESQVISSSLKYFGLGSIGKYNEIGEPLEEIAPNEFAYDIGYSRKLTDNWAGSILLRYIRSDIYQGEEDLYPGNSFATDIAFFYTKDFLLARKESNLSWGINLSNIGNKISYDKGNIKDFIPTNLRTGLAYTTEINQYNQISFAIDLNKLLVPSLIKKINGEKWLNGEIDNPRNLGNSEYGVIEGILRSFADAPDGIENEFSEITSSFGFDWMLKNHIDLRKYKIDHSTALRLGYFNESIKNGDRKFITFGLGKTINLFSVIGGSFDLSYIYTLSRTSPLENTLRFSMGIFLNF